jgi:beta-glucosidase
MDASRSLTAVVPICFVDAFLSRTALTGQLPFDMPSSMSAVERSREYVPIGTEAPLFRAGFGIRREATSERVPA